LEKKAMSTVIVNGRKRPTLSDQINRLDSILDGLAENLDAAVAAAVKEAAGIAIKEAVQGVLTEVLSNPELLDRLRPEPAVTGCPQGPAAPGAAEEKRGWLSRLAGVVTAAGGKVVALTRRAKARVAQLAPRCWETLSANLKNAGRRVKMLSQNVWRFLASIASTSWRARRPLLVALGVGAVVGGGCYLAGPVVASAVSGLAGFVGSLAASAVNSLRQALGGLRLQDT
jgi:hypothetical protein